MRSQFFSVGLVVFGLVFLVALERQFGLPVVSTVLAITVLSQTSAPTQLVGAVAVGLMVALSFVIPLWMGVLLLGCSILSVATLSERWRTTAAVVAAAGCVTLWVVGGALETSWQVVGWQVAVLIMVRFGWFFSQSWWQRWQMWRPGKLFLRR